MQQTTASAVWIAGYQKPQPYQFGKAGYRSRNRKLIAMKKKKKWRPLFCFILFLPFFISRSYQFWITFLIHVYSGTNCKIFGTGFPLLSLLVDEEKRQIITGSAEGQVLYVKNNLYVTKYFTIINFSITKLHNLHTSFKMLQLF